jgi:hypothetical protein
MKVNVLFGKAWWLFWAACALVTSLAVLLSLSFQAEHTLITWNIPPRNLRCS